MIDQTQLLKLQTTSRYRKDRNLAKKRGLDLTLLDSAIASLLARKPLDSKYRDHALTEQFAGFRECHILLDWLLIYYIDDDRLILTATRTGTHSDLFKETLINACLRQRRTISQLPRKVPAGIPVGISRGFDAGRCETRRC
jgi:mRNA interferase YafQ